MKKLLVAAAAVLWLASSCIVSDQLVTITIHPDGSADYLRLQSNIRSTETGDKGKQEVMRFVEDFEARNDSDMTHIREAGGELLEVRIVRREEPYAAVLHGKLPNAKALEEFCTIKEKSGEPSARTTFTKDGARRRFTVAIRVPKGDSSAVKPTDEERRQERADGVSETRIVAAGGRILSSSGFTVAEDKRSALLNTDELNALARAGGERELYLEWEVSGN